MIKKVAFLFLSILLFSTTLCGCTVFFETGIDKTISGYVTLDGNGLKNVSIRTNNKVFTKTDENGAYSFSTKQSNIKIYAEKDGYIFSGTFTLTESVDTANFLATKIVPLTSGKLNLSKIIIVPTSIIALADNNYSYTQNSKSCLKIGGFDAQINNQNLNITETFYAEKSQKNSIPFSSDISITLSESTKMTIQFKTHAYFKIGINEALMTQNNWLIMTKVNLTNADIINEKITISSLGINSPGSFYSYNLFFVFDYTFE